MIKIAIVGTGEMAHSHASGFETIRGCKVVAACDIVQEKAEAFARKHHIPHVYEDVEHMLKDLKIDAISNVTPDSSHAPISLLAIAKGKHVLCEKPLAMDFPEAKGMAVAAKRGGVINMVNLSYRNCPALYKARELVHGGQIGQVMHFAASYLQSWLSSKCWGDWRESSNWLWRLSQKHGSQGVLGDIGVHILDFASYAAGDIKTVNCRLRTFPKAKGNRIGEYVLDANDSAVVIAELANGALGTIHTSRWATGHKNSLQLRIYGDRGCMAAWGDGGGFLLVA